MRIIDWNISYSGKSKSKFEYLEKVINNEPVIIILQEVIPSSYEALKDHFPKFNIEYSLIHRPPSKFDTKSRDLGVVIMTSKDIEIISAKVLDRCLLPDRTLLVEAKYNDKILKVMGLHSITGCDHKKAKSIQFYSFAEAIDTYKPDVVGIDANEPEVDCYNIDGMVFFDNKDKGKGAKTFFETIYENGLVDSLAKKYNIENFENGEPLTVSHKVSGKYNKRYDFVFLNSVVFEEYNTEYDFENSKNAGSDHAIIKVDALI